jgi:hypothetical protein
MLNAISSGNDRLVGKANNVISSSLATPDEGQCYWPDTRGQWARSEYPRLLYSQETFIGFEMSLVPQVEAVIVERLDGVRSLRVTTVIDKRDPAVRAEVYAREKAIMDSPGFAGISFDFHVIARMGDHLEEIIGDIGKLAWKR